MTPLEALDDMIAAVRAGETSRVHIERMSGQAMLAEAGSIYGAAYQDDLNAARKVHEALVPGWETDIIITQMPNVMVSTRYAAFDAQCTALGRTWLLACLKAHRSTLVPS